MKSHSTLKNGFFYFIIFNLLNIVSSLSNIKQMLIRTLIFLSVFFVGLSCNSKKQQPASRKHLVALFPFNKIVHQTIDENTALLGKPATVVSDIANDSTIIHHFEKGDYELVITYSANTKKPVELYLTTLDDQYPDNVNVYFDIINFKLKDTINNQIVFHKSMNDTSLYSGLSIIPKSVDEASSQN